MPRINKGPYVVEPARIGETISALVPFWGDKPTSFISEKNYSARTARRELTTLRVTVKPDFRQGRISTAIPVWLPSRPEGKDRWLTRVEAATIGHIKTDGRLDRNFLKRQAGGTINALLVAAGHNMCLRSLTPWCFGVPRL